MGRRIAAALAGMVAIASLGALTAAAGPATAAHAVATGQDHSPVTGDGHGAGDDGGHGQAQDDQDDQDGWDDRADAQDHGQGQRHEDGDGDGDGDGGQGHRGRGRRGDILVIGHRGASGYRPEHTLAAYELAIRQCADFVEPDLVSTKDGVLVARHENEIGGTTDVAAHPEFAGRRTTKVIDGTTVTGWFTEDFTWAELRTLRAKERIPATRPQNTAYDGRFPIPSLQQVLDLARRSRTCDGDEVGVYPETKHPSYFDGLGLSMEEPLVRTLEANGYRNRRDPVFVQSFEVGNLQQLDRMTDVRIVQLVNCSGRPWDFTVAGDTRTYADLVTPAGLRFVDRYADGIGACKDVMIPRDAAGELTRPTPVIRDAHRQGLIVHGWTFRRENQFLPTDLRSSTDPNAPGDIGAEIEAFVGAGMDGLFTDNPDLAATTVD